MSDQDEESRETHPAYGMIGFSRVTNGGAYTKHKLFGSSLDNHPTTIRLRIKHCERSHGLSHDFYYAKGLITEVELSAGQFAELLTTMNMGDGVPCTVRYADGEQIEEIPAQKMEVERVRAGFEKRMKGVGKKLRTFMDSAKETLAKKNLTKDDREQLLGQLRMFVQEMESNVPFALTSFEEATDKVVNHAKAEVDAFMTTAVMNAGFKSLALQGAEPSPPVPMIEAKVLDKGIEPPTHPKKGDKVEIEDEGQWLPGEVTAVTADYVQGFLTETGEPSAFSYTIDSYRRNWRYR